MIAHVQDSSMPSWLNHFSPSGNQKRFWRDSRKQGRAFWAGSCHECVMNFMVRLVSPLQKWSGAYGIRTRDLLNAIEALYQLS
jgi:hypothetical protein